MRKQFLGVPIWISILWAITFISVEITINLQHNPVLTSILEWLR